MNIARLIDHTNLKADAKESDIRQTCLEAKEYSFRSVCINPGWVKFAKKELGGTNVKVAPVIDWPIGASTTEGRVALAKIAKFDGADEMDVVLDIGNFKAGNYGAVLEDLKSLSKILPTKVIIETGYLTEEEIKKASLLVKEANCCCVKTSTGIEPKVDVKTKILHIKLIREAVGPDFPIKAAGGIKTMEDAQGVIAAGATIIGTSSGAEIIKGGESRSGY